MYAYFNKEKHSGVRKIVKLTHLYERSLNIYRCQKLARILRNLTLGPNAILLQGLAAVMICVFESYLNVR